MAGPGAVGFGNRLCHLLDFFVHIIQVETMSNNLKTPGNTASLRETQQLMSKSQPSSTPWLEIIFTLQHQPAVEISKSFYFHRYINTTTWLSMFQLGHARTHARTHAQRIPQNTSEFIRIQGTLKKNYSCMHRRRKSPRTCPRPISGVHSLVAPGA